MSNVQRRDFLKTSALGAAGGLLSVGCPWASARGDDDFALESGGRDFSLVSGQEREKIPSACWQCVTRCAIVCYLEHGRLVKIEGNPNMLSTGGTLCPRGQAGVNQLYHPDRLLHPMVRTGGRGEGKWKEISWEAALDLLVDGGDIAGKKVKGLKTLREEGTPEKYMFHYGRMVGTDYLINLYYFMNAYGSATIGNHDSICMSTGGVGFSLIGDMSGDPGYEKARVILNFGSSELEAGTNHLPAARACAAALARGAKMYTFDVRLSNTGAKSTEWVPVKPGTDLAVALSMCHVLMEEGLHDEAFIRDHTNASATELKTHLAEYTPEWAENISGVPARTIRRIALEFAQTRPGTVTLARGAFMHHNGVQATRAIMMLLAISGNLAQRPSTAPRPRWNYGAVPFPQPAEPPKALDILHGPEGAYAFTGSKVSHQILQMIDRGSERPEIYLVYCHNPVYSNGHCAENARVLKSEEKIPFLVAVDVALSETSELADLVLPDATYLERWTLEAKTSPEGVPEYYLRQPVHPPVAEARNYVDVVCQIAERLDLNLGFGSAGEYVRKVCDNTPGVKEAGGFEYMKAHGIWHDRNARAEEYNREQLTLRSDELARNGFDALPTWVSAPEHEQMSEDELILTTFKVTTQSHSRTQNCKWLTEIYHENPAWINSQTAAARGIKDGDTVRIRSSVGEMVTRAFVTEGVHPRAVAISNHCGHWAYGQYASGKKSSVHKPDADSHNQWWTGSGVHPNHIIPNKGDPVSGGLCWMDTVVTLERV